MHDTCCNRGICYLRTISQKCLSCRHVAFSVCLHLGWLGFRSRSCTHADKHRGTPAQRRICTLLLLSVTRWGLFFLRLLLVRFWIDSWPAASGIPWDRPLHKILQECFCRAALFLEAGLHLRSPNLLDFGTCLAYLRDGGLDCFEAIKPCLRLALGSLAPRRGWRILQQVLHLHFRLRQLRLLAGGLRLLWRPSL